MGREEGAGAEGASRTLTGEALEEHLQRIDEAFEDDRLPHDAQARADAVAAMLAPPGVTLHPHEPYALSRLVDLWSRIGQPDRALALLEQHAPGVIATLAPEQQPGATWAYLLMGRVRLHGERGDTAELQAACSAASAALEAMPTHEQSFDAWSELAQAAAQLQDRTLQRHALERAFELGRASSEPDEDDESAAYRARSRALYELGLALTFAEEGQQDEARQRARQVLEGLVIVDSRQRFDADDWWAIGEGLVAVAPELEPKLADIARARTAHQTTSPALRRTLEVVLARLRARAARAQGRLQEALAALRQGADIPLIHDDGHDTGVFFLDTLVEAGQLDAAAELAASYSFVGWRSRHRARELARRQLSAGTHRHVGWPLAIAFEQLGEDGPLAERRATAAPHLALAREWAPQDPRIALTEALLLDRETDSAQALAILERVLPLLPDYCDADTLFALWECRARQHGVARGLALPPVEPSSGVHAYAMGVYLSVDDRFDALFGDEDKAANAAMRQLERVHYEFGLRHFETFFDTGRGRPGDGDVHTYSMLCNNLAVAVENEGPEARRFAISLHEKGMASSPFAEHLSHWRWCLWEDDHHAEMIEVAERLWNYSQRYGFSRHQPQHYVDDVSYALYALDRHDEIPIWLERLEQWWQGLDPEEQAEQRPSYMQSLLYVLRQMAWSHPADALARVRPYEAEVRSSLDPGWQQRLGYIHHCAGEFEQAQALYDNALKLGDPRDPAVQRQHQVVRDSIESMHQSDGYKAWRRSQRPWWKPWG